MALLTSKLRLQTQMIVDANRPEKKISFPNRRRTLHFIILKFPFPMSNCNRTCKKTVSIQKFRTNIKLGVGINLLDYCTVQTIVDLLFAIVR